MLCSTDNLRAFALDSATDLVRSDTLMDVLLLKNACELAGVWR
ncbi:hypothetical protein JCM19239_7718 [Vibrio variabilis]|uniref:Uncharacterized protein n=1 Tax=Vibrio variabilis TaxID=990271 RepID=A0ABQ0J4Q5_9VIBR|nr:hypothetical protein JCM19239_7718 [Vibrio variabilis]